MVVDHGMGMPVIELGQRVVGRRNHEIGAEQQAGFARGDAYRMDFLLRRGDAHMPGHGTELLREPCLVQHRYPFLFDVCRHAQHRTDG